MTRQDEIAARAVRRSTLKSLKVKKTLRIRQIKEQAVEQIRAVNIQYAEDPERLKAKYASEDYARTERNRKRAERRIAKEKLRIEFENKQRRYTTGEEIFSAIVQGLGIGLFIAATVLLVLRVQTNAPHDAMYKFFMPSFCCFSASMILMYIMSTLHHALTPDGAKEVFNRLTHAFIFLVLGCSYTAFSLTALHGPVGWILFGIVWVISLVGIVLYAVFGRRFDLGNMIFYLVIGWAALFVCKRLYHVLPAKSFGMLITSGLTYTLGIVFYRLGKIRYMHAICNVFMLMGSVYLFFSLFFSI